MFTRTFATVALAVTLGVSSLAAATAAVAPPQKQALRQAHKKQLATSTRATLARQANMRLRWHYLMAHHGNIRGAQLRALTSSQGPGARAAHVRQQVVRKAHIQTATHP